MSFPHRAMVILAICLASLAGTSSAAYASQLVFADEFDGPLNTATWANRTPWNTDFTIGELERYDPADCTFSGGLMSLRSEKRPTAGYPWYLPDGFDYTSGIVTSLNKPKFSYGYFEIRAKLPKGPGIWPAFWLTNDSTLEIDGLEMLGDRPTRIYQTLHINKSMVSSSYHDGPDYSAGFHTYGIDWQPTYVKWYIDGVLTKTLNRPMPSDPLWICLNTAVGGSWPGSPTAETTFPVSYDIDYMRVYDTKPAADTVPVVTAPTPKVTTPKVRKKSGTTYTVSGAASIGVQSSAAFAASGTETAKASPIVLTVQVQQYRTGAWRTHSAKKLTSPPATYKTTVKLSPGRFRVRTLLSGDIGASARSPWSATVRVP